MNAIRTINLTKRFQNKVAVDDLNMSIEQGELYALLGMNGAGKTTTIKMLSCLIPPTSGDAVLLEEDEGRIMRSLTYTDTLTYSIY